MAAHAVEITMTEDMIEAMMIGTIPADRTEEEEEDGGGWRAAQDRDQKYRRRSPSPYYSRGGYRSRSRSRSYSPHRY